MFFALLSPSKSQTFQLIDTTFNVGDSLIHNIYFDFNKTQILSESKLFLDSMANLLIKFNSLKIEIGIHTSFIGNDHYNEKLSQKRAEQIKNYLVKKGVNQSNLKGIGYGEKLPIISKASIDKVEKKEKIKLDSINNRHVFKIIDI